MQTDTQRSKLFVESIPEILYTILPDGTLDYLSPYFYEYTGLTTVVDLGAGWASVVHPEDMAGAAALWRHAIQTGESLLLEFRMRRFDGMYRWFRARSVAQRDSSGTIHAWIGICVDIDDERRMLDDRAQLLEREQAARAVAEAAVLRLAYLQRTTAALASAQTLQHVAEVIAEQCRSAFGAAASAVRLLSDDGAFLEEVRAIGHDQELLANLAHVPIDLPLTITDAVRTKQSILVSTAEELTERYPEQARLTGHYGYQSFIAAPLLRGDAAIGVLGLAFTESGRLVPEDITLLEAIAQQCIQAIERAWLYAAEHAARAEAADLLAQLDVVIDKAPIGMGFVDIDFRYVRINEALAAINQLPVEAHIGQRARDLFPAYGSTWEAYMQQVLTTGRPITNLAVTNSIDNALHHYQVSYYPVRLTDATVRGIGVVVSDVTERRQGEITQTLLARASSILSDSLEYEQTLQGVAQLLVPELADYCAINLVDNETVQTVALLHRDLEQQPLLERLYSTTATAFLPELPLGHVIQSRTALLAPVLDAFIDQLPYPTWQRDILHQLGARSSLVVPLLARKRVLGAITLVMTQSERRYSEADQTLAEELARRCALAIENALLYRDAQAAIQLRDAFLSVAAHELRTPLTSLQGNAQMLQRRFARAPELPQRDLHAVDVIVSQSDRLNKMIATLLDVSRLQRGQLAINRAPVDLRALINRIVSETQLSLANHVLETELPEQPLVITADELRLEQVLTNLVQNSVKYTPDGGTITIRAEQSRETVLIAVSDSGIGIPADALPQLFQRFYRARNAASQHIGGLGIGLFVAREIVQMHGGTIIAQSIEGQGTTMVVHLPVVG